jgi:hypothetical protein
MRPPRHREDCYKLTEGGEAAPPREPSEATHE